jgi:hypothetical protein
VKLIFRKSESWWEAKEASIVFTVIEVNWFRSDLTFALIQQGILCNNSVPCVISGFCRAVDDNCTILGYYAASSGNFFPAFRDNLSVPSSGVV